MSQNSTVLPTTGILSGLEQTERINDALDTIITRHLGPAAPAITKPSMIWIDTGTTIDATGGPWIRKRNTGDTAWLREGHADADFIAELVSQVYNSATTTGTAPSFVITPLLAWTSYAADQRLRVKFHANGTGADTGNVSTLGTKNIKQYDSTGSKIAAVIVAGQLADVECDGTDLVILNPLPAGSGAFSLSSDISPAQITADQNDYNPTSLLTASTLRLNSDASRNITGLQGGSNGRLLIIHNVGAQSIVLKDESASSTAANRFALTADLTLAADAVAMLQYDSTSSRWRSISSVPASTGSTLGTPVASTSGTAIDFSSIPSWVKRITLSFSGVSHDSTTSVLVQLADSGTVRTTGYSSGSATDGGTRVTSSAGILATGSISTSGTIFGLMTLVLANASTNLWVATSVTWDVADSGPAFLCGGSKTLSGVLDRIRVTTVSGSANFDAGSMNILYE